MRINKMEANKVQEIYFINTKNGHLAAIVNNSFSVVKNTEKEPIYNVYQNVATGWGKIESTPELVEEFTNAFQNYLSEKERVFEEKRQKVIEVENARIRGLKKQIEGLTPNDFCAYFKIEAVETASHWSDLHKGRSSFGLIISSEKELELVQLAIEVNGWGGEYGELVNRNGEHHHTFDRLFDIDDYRERIVNHFYSEYIFNSQKESEEVYLERIQECETMEEVLEIVEEYNNIETGFYCGGVLVYKGDDFSDFWGYYEDSRSYSFGYKFPTKDYFYNGDRQELEDE